MTNPPTPVLRTAGEVTLTGAMAIYNSQAEASQGIPQQWRTFLRDHPALPAGAQLHGASPCTPDRRIHYLTGVAGGSLENMAGCELLTLPAGEYAFVLVNDPSLLRDTWVWLLHSWLATSGRKEKNAPEFERYTAISQDGTPLGPVEIWIPLEPLANPQSTG